MMYENLLSRVYNQPHLIRPEKLEEIRKVVAGRMLGIHADAAVIAAVTAEAARERKPQMNRSVAVLPVLGTLAKRMGMMSESSGGTSTDRVGRELDRLMADESVDAVVLDLDSPGGETFGVRELSDKIYGYRGKKPIVASANAEAASAAYWIGSAANELVVTPSGWVGSVGVVMVHSNLSKLNEEVGVQPTYIYAGQYKVEGNPDGPLAPETIAHYQTQVDAIYEQFVAAVARNRGASAKSVRETYGEGRMLFAESAKAAGMVDRIETLDETIARLAKGGAVRRSLKLARERLALEKYR